ncbi:Peptide-N4-(N-acetyl-beta-glucosaminyl)asparagine amidase A protein [Raphanus sativus]|nr:Peptide-N4-(N-acetyl-beta-glucosaminyl)asparagine amidase A protein [Raphanus sativus]
MSSSLPPLLSFLFFFTAFFLSAAVADHHDKNQISLQTTSLLLLLSIPKRHVTHSLLRSQKATRPLSLLHLNHRHARTNSSTTTSLTPTRNPVLANYTLPSHCPPPSSRQFSKIILEFRSTSRGRQFDRIFGVWLDGVELLRSCTAEPTQNGIVWSVEKDVTKYHSLLVDDNKTRTLALYLGNIVDKTYTGVYHVDLIFHYHYPPLDSSHHNNNNSPSRADTIIPISRNLPLNDGLWFEISSLSDSKRKEFKIPRNVYRAVLEVYVSFHENDEFWYGNLPNDFITANNLSVSGGNGPFREVVVTLDGRVAGAVWPFPVVFTGGINPLLWRPVTAIGSFDLPSYDIELTPFLGSLLDGEGHEFGFSVTNALNVWFVDANLHLWLDREKEVVEGEVLEVSRSCLEISSVSEFEGLNGKFKTEAKRSISLSGLVKSSRGDIVTTSHQEFRYVNEMVLGKDGSLQIIDQLIEAEDRVHAKRGSRAIYAAKSIKRFPFYLYSDSLEQEDSTSLEVANVTMGFNEERSESDYGMVRTFKSKLENKQEGQGVMVVKNNLVVNGYGGTQQVYNYVGSDQCYSRNISSFNYDILYDEVETVCKKTALKMPEDLTRLETLTALLL